jgi:hypothetical protein
MILKYPAMPSRSISGPTNSIVLLLITAIGSAFKCLERPARRDRAKRHHEVTAVVVPGTPQPRTLGSAAERANEQGFDPVT